MAFYTVCEADVRVWGMFMDHIKSIRGAGPIGGRPVTSQPAEARFEGFQKWLVDFSERAPPSSQIWESSSARDLRNGTNCEGFRWIYVYGLNPNDHRTWNQGGLSK